LYGDLKRDRTRRVGTRISSFGQHGQYRWTEKFASSEESVGEGERQGWLSTRNLRSFLQVESARQNATFIFGRERRETGDNVGHVKFCCNSASEVET
jgi:hypothetical protein